MQQHGRKYCVCRPNPTPPPNPGDEFDKVLIQLCQNMVMLHNKLKGMQHRAQCKHIFSPYTHPQPVGWIKRCQSKCSHAA